MAGFFRVQPQCHEALSKCVTSPAVELSGEGEQGQFLLAEHGLSSSRILEKRNERGKGRREITERQENERRERARRDDRNGKRARRKVKIRQAI